VAPEEKREPWQSYVWGSAILGGLFAGFLFFAWVWNDGRWVWFHAPSRDGSLDQVAGYVLRSLEANDFQSAAAQFDSTSSRVLRPEELETKWAQLTTRLGTLRSWALLQHVQQEGKELWMYRLQFERGRVNAVVTFGPNGVRVQGLDFVPSENGS